MTRFHRPRRMTAVRLAGVALAVLFPLTGACASGARVADTAAQQPPTPTVTPSPMVKAPATTSAAPVRTTSATRIRPRKPAPSRTRVAAPPVTAAGAVVVLDPGHNGGNASHPGIVNRPVYAGNGLTKPCNSVGAETLGGYPEHAFTFDIALRTRVLLARQGVTVLLTRPNDDGVGPCVDARARFGNEHAAAAVVAIHADGAAPGGHGFHVIEAASSPGGARMAAASRQLALAVRARLVGESGLTYATYLAGGTGLTDRGDLAGLNLSTRPAIFVECGNMQNPGDAALQTSPPGRQRIAQALADGIVAYLAGR